MQNRQRNLRNAESRTPSHRPLDINRERLVFAVSNLVGQRVTAKLRDNIIYEGLFHTCALDGDFSITLKLARKLPTQECKSGEMIPVFVIPGKDFLQVSAVGVPSPTDNSTDRFTTDAEIAARGQAGRERDLVPWHGEDEEREALEDTTAGREGWDQFEANEQRFGVKTTFNEELYTTKLNPARIPQAMRESAEKIAQEIESGQMATEVEGVGDDEEGHFSAVSRPKEPNEQVEVRLTKEYLHQHDSQMVPAGFARAKQGNAAPRSPISEMKRINALNLEPALPKLDDKTRNDWINIKQQARQATKPPGQGCLKQEFQQSLEVIQKREASRRQQEQAVAEGEGRRGKSAVNSQMQPDQMFGKGMQSAGCGSASESSMASKSFSFNAQAREFNPNAPGFTPSNPNQNAMFTPQSQPPQPQPPTNGSNAPITKSNLPTFTTNNNPDLLRMNLETILKPFFDMAKNEGTETTAPDWPEAQGPSYVRVLGMPSAANLVPPTVPIASPGSMPSGWQPGMSQAPVAPGGAPMQGQIQQGFMMAPAGQGQMYPQMYPSGVRPQNSNVSNDGPCMQVFGQQGMIDQPSQSMAMPCGQNMPMGSFAKFGGQTQPTVVVPMVMQGQYGQGFVPPRGQGQGQGGPMMQQPMYQGHMGNCGSGPHQMAGHDG